MTDAEFIFLRFKTYIDWKHKIQNAQNFAKNYLREIVETI